MFIFMNDALQKNAQKYNTGKTVGSELNDFPWLQSSNKRNANIFFTREKCLISLQKNSYQENRQE